MCTLGKILWFWCRTNSFNCNFSWRRADIIFLNIFTHFKTFSFVFLDWVNLIHYLSPESFVIRLVTAKRYVFIITCPNWCCKIWCISTEPKVIFTWCCTGFTWYGHFAIKFSTCTCTFCNNACHTLCKKACSRSFQNSMCSRSSVIKKDTSIAVYNLWIKNRSCISSLICDCCICSSHF